MVDQSQLPWFTSKGQVIQTVLQFLAPFCAWVFSSWKGWRPQRGNLRPWWIIALLAGGAFLVGVLAPLGAFEKCLALFLSCVLPLGYTWLGDEPHFKRGNPFLVYCMTSHNGPISANTEMGVCDATVACIKNSQVSVVNSANGVRATIRYKHADRVSSFVIRDGPWFYDRSLERHDTAALAGNREARLAIFFEQRIPARQSFPAYFVIDETGECQELSAGRWSVHAEITSDNARPITLTGHLTVVEDRSHRYVELGGPFLTLKRPRSLRW